MIRAEPASRPAADPRAGRYNQIYGTWTARLQFEEPRKDAVLRNSKSTRPLKSEKLAAKGSLEEL
jgi:hypothetical protein